MTKPATFRSLLQDLVCNRFADQQDAWTACACAYDAREISRRELALLEQAVTTYYPAA